MPHRLAEAAFNAAALAVPAPVAAVALQVATAHATPSLAPYIAIGLTLVVQLIGTTRAFTRMEEMAKSHSATGDEMKKGLAAVQASVSGLSTAVAVRDEWCRHVEREITDLRQAGAHAVRLPAPRE